MEIAVVGEDKSEIERWLDEAQKIFRIQENIFSRFDAGSELSKLNNSLGKKTPVSDDMLEAIQKCLDFYEISEGYFDPRILETLEKIGYAKSFFSPEFGREMGGEVTLENNFPPLEEDVILNKEEKTILLKKRIDLSGIAKGLTVDKVSGYLQKNNCQNFLVDAGGDMFGQGADEKGNHWTIDVEGADEKTLFRLEDEGIATSGIGRRKWSQGGKRFHHLVNPKKPEEFSFGLRTVTVIAPEAAEADALAKTLFLMGKEKGLAFAEEKNIKALFLDYKGNTYLSGKIKENKI